MKKALILPALAAVMSAACGGGDGPTDTTPTARVRFVNATSGMAGSGGFTTNGQFASGSALASGQVMETCATIDPGTTSFAFGTANAAGTGLSGSALVTSNAETLVAGGSYTVVSGGSATSPALLLLSNGFSGVLGANQAAVRFISLAAATGATVPNYVFYRGEIGAAPPLALNLPFGVASGYTVVPSGSNTFSAMQTPGNVFLVPGSTATLQAGSVNTIALLRNTSGGFQLINIPGC